MQVSLQHFSGNPWSNLIIKWCGNNQTTIAPSKCNLMLSIQETSCPDLGNRFSTNLIFIYLAATLLRKFDLTL